MSDFASIIGGGADPFPAIDPNGSHHYSWTGGNVFQDLGNSDDQWVSSSDTGSETVYGGNGDDSIFGGNGDGNLLSGQNGDDNIGGGTGHDTISGGNGDDTIHAGEGNNFVSGDNGDDIIGAGSGDDTLMGGNGKDQLFGGAGQDQLFGGSGDDSLYGGDGHDVLYGQSGNDYLEGGSGDDTLWGGSGNDVFFFDSNFGNDVIADFSAGDEIWLKADLNGSGIASANDLIANGMVTGGTENGKDFTLIQIGGDSIRIDNMNADDFKASITSWVKVQ